MSRFISELDNSSGSYGVGQGVFNIKAGAVIGQNDLVQLGPNGKAYPVQCTDYAAVANCNYGTPQTNAATGRIVAQTLIVNGVTAAFSRQAVAQSDDGSIYTLTNDSSNQGLKLSKYSAAGELIAQFSSDSSGANSYQNHQLLVLSNGNVLISACRVSDNKIYYAVYNSALLEIKGIAASEAMADNYYSACSLAGGGFCFVYQQQASPLLTRLSTFSNVGDVVLAPTTIWTRTGASGAQYYRVEQLSNGNLVVAVSSTNTGADIGLFHGIVTTGGVSVVNFANLDTHSISTFPEVSVMPGYYAIARPGSVMRGFVFGNDGALRGAGFNGGASGGTQRNQYKLANDGKDFWLIWARSIDNNEVLTKLPSTGTGYSTTIVRLNLSQYSEYIDAFCENGFIVCASQNPGSNISMRMWVISTATGQLINKAGTDFGVSPGGQGGQYHRLIPGGDFSFICLYDYSNTASTNLAVGKYANTAIMGVAQAGAPTEGLAAVAGIAGGYAANYIKGSSSKSFDHSATNIAGNKGAIMNYGAVMKGF